MSMLRYTRRLCKHINTLDLRSYRHLLSLTSTYVQWHSTLVPSHSRQRCCPADSPTGSDGGISFATPWSEDMPANGDDDGNDAIVTIPLE